MLSWWTGKVNDWDGCCVHTGGAIQAITNILSYSHVFIKFNKIELALVEKFNFEDKMSWRCRKVIMYFFLSCFFNSWTGPARQLQSMLSIRKKGITFFHGLYRYPLIRFSFLFQNDNDDDFLKNACVRLKCTILKKNIHFQVASSTTWI